MKLIHLIIALVIALASVSCSETEFQARDVQAKKNDSEAKQMNDDDAKGAFGGDFENLGVDSGEREVDLDALGEALGTTFGEDDSSDDASGSAGSDMSPEGSSDSVGVDGSSDSVGIDGSSLAHKGKSLDLYFLIDVSGSLKATDPDCDRFDAIIDFKKELTDFLGADGDVRTTLIKFSDKAKHFGTINNFLTLSNGEFKDKYKDDICDRDGSTNTADALEEAVDRYNDLKGDPKDTKSALLFTDGMPTKGVDQLSRRINDLKATFGKQIYSVLLWNEAFTSFFGGASKKDAQKFLKEVTGSSDRVKSVDDPSGIGKAIAEFLK